MEIPRSPPRQVVYRRLRSKRRATHSDISSTADKEREFVYRNVLQLQELLRIDRTRLKPVLARHMDQLTLKPVQTSNGAEEEMTGGHHLHYIISPQRQVHASGRLIDRGRAELQQSNPNPRSYSGT